MTARKTGYLSAIQQDVNQTNMESAALDKSIEIIFRELKGIITENDYTEYSAKKNENEKFTQTIFRIYNGERLSRLALEQYTINSKAFGVVLNIYPKSEYGIPIFTFQLGGQIPEKVIFVLDIVPVIGDDACQGLREIKEKYSSGSPQLGSSQDWINQICSENALICQYKPFDEEIILSALTAYLCFWRDKCYIPAQNSITTKSEEEAIKSILKFKTLLHANDAGLDIYRKKFGEKMAAVIIDAAFGSAPSLEEEKDKEQAVSDAVDANTGRGGEITWTKEAEEYLQEAPKFVHSKIRNNAETKAKEQGLKEITADFIAKLRK